MVRFVDWVRNNPDQHESLSVLFTPWGEGLTRSWYRDAMVTLSRVSHVERVAIQTNLAGRLTWLSEADPSRVALWATYHPGEVLQDRFLGQCATLDRMGIRYSVGVVGLPEHLEAARRMRSALPASVYLWVNAAEGHSYDAAEEAAWTELDPAFRLQRPAARVTRTRVLGRRDRGLGSGRRHGASLSFHPDRHRKPVRRLLPGPAAAEACVNAVCDCHIGYVHLKRLGLHELFEGGLLERIPTWGAPATIFR